MRIPPDNVEDGTNQHETGCCASIYDSFNLATAASTQILVRRIGMIAILLIRVWTVALAIIVYAFFAFNPLLLIPILLELIIFVWCLSCIGDMGGERRMCGVAFTRLHFDLYLLAILLFHITVIGGMYGRLPHIVISAIWVTMFFGMIIASFLSTRRPGYSSV